MLGAFVITGGFSLDILVKMDQSSLFKSPDSACDLQPLGVPVTGKQTWFDRNFIRLVSLMIFAGIVVVVGFDPVMGYLGRTMQPLPTTSDASSKLKQPEKAKTSLQDWPNLAPPDLPVLDPIPFQLDDSWPDKYSHLKTKCQIS